VRRDMQAAFAAARRVQNKTVQSLPAALCTSGSTEIPWSVVHVLAVGVVPIPIAKVANPISASTNQQVQQIATILPPRDGIPHFKLHEIHLVVTAALWGAVAWLLWHPPICRGAQHGTAGSTVPCHVCRRVQPGAMSSPTRHQGFAKGRGKGPRNEYLLQPSSIENSEPIVPYHAACGHARTL